MTKGKYDGEKGKTTVSVYEGLDPAHQAFLEDLGGHVNGYQTNPGIPGQFTVTVHNIGNSCGDYCWDENRHKWICC